MAKLGRRFVLSELEEQVLTRSLALAAKRRCPFEPRDIRTVVRDYLNSIPQKVAEFGDKNTLSDEWVRAFIKQHLELRIKFAENIKRSRAEVSREALLEYFKELEITLKGVPGENVMNYDETCFVDDPRKTKVGI
jgi:hypothetical protein